MDMVDLTSFYFGQSLHETHHIVEEINDKTALFIETRGGEECCNTVQFL